MSVPQVPWGLREGERIEVSSSPQRLNGPNREAWLEALVEAFRPMLAPIGPLPDIRITCGFPSKGGLARRRLVLGQCWGSRSSAAGRTEIFISPVMDDAFDVAHVTLHELLHAVVGCQHGHRAPFKRAADRVGFVGKPTCNVPGEALADRIRSQILPDLGPYPHARLKHPNINIEIIGVPELEIPKANTRLIKVACDNCGYVARVARKWLVHPGPPLCPCSDTPMVVERAR
jgi:hypothetical protein